jgi:uncharacterized protein involved in exopolysaccharide biosynthesis
VNRLTFDLPFANNLPGATTKAHGEQLAANAMLAIWRRRYRIFGIVLLSLVAAIGVLSVLEKKYVSEAVVQLDLYRPEIDPGSRQTPAVTLDASSLVQSEAQIIRSRLLARRVVDSLGLANDPAYAHSGNGFSDYLNTAEVAIADAVAWFRGDVALPEVGPPADNVQDATGRIARAIADVMRGLTVATDQRSYLITIAYSSTDPVRSAKIANAVADEYVRLRMQGDIDSANQTIEWLSVQIRGATETLREAEDAITAFRDRTGMLDAGRANSDAENVPQQNLRALASQVTAASLARLNEERRSARVQELLKAGAIPSFTDLNSPLLALLVEREALVRRELGELMSRLGPRHPDVLQAQAGISDIRSRVSAEVNRAVSVITSDLAAARQLEDDLKGRLDAQQRMMVSGKVRETELKALQDRAEAIRERLVVLTRSSEQALASRELKRLAATVLPAEPVQFPSSPKPLMIIAVALGAGLCTGLAYAVLAEGADQGVRTSEDVREHFNNRCLGMVPELPAQKFGFRTPRSRPIFDEAIYSIGAGVQLFGTAGGECRTILLTSSVPGEGVSTLCMALAQSLVEAGQRVMLVACPPMRGSSQNARPAAPPPGDAAPSPLSSESSLVVLDRKHPFMLTASVSGPGGFGSLLHDARKHFDVILLEGAPVMLVADTLVLGRLADSVILVTRWASTRRWIVEAALRRLQEHSITVDGIALARVNLRRHARLRFLDECFFYSKEKRFYQSLARQSDQVASSSSKAV